MEKYVAVGIFGLILFLAGLTVWQLYRRLAQAQQRIQKLQEQQDKHNQQKTTHDPA